MKPFCHVTAPNDRCIWSHPMEWGTTFISQIIVWASLVRAATLQLFWHLTRCGIRSMRKSRTWLALEHVATRLLTWHWLSPEHWDPSKEIAQIVIIPADKGHKHCPSPGQNSSFHLTPLNQSIQFTMEPEENGELPFLDFLITHHPDSSDPYSLLKGPVTVVQCLCMVRWGKACVQIQSSEIERLWSSSQRHFTRQWPLPDTEPPKATIVIPYIRNLSELIRQVLTPSEFEHASDPTKPCFGSW